MYSGSRAAACARPPRPARHPAPSGRIHAPPAPTSWRGTTYPTSRWLAGGVLAGDHRGLRHARAARPAPASISPGSIRNPRTFTWSSARPANTSSPSGRPPRQVPGPVHPLPRPAERARHEPLRRSAPAGPGTPAPAPPRPTYSSPATPAGTGPSHSSSTYTRVFATGGPSAGRPARPAAPLVAIITVASVGPYAFDHPPPGRPPRRQLGRQHASPPTTSTPNPGPAPAGTPASTLGTISAWLIRLPGAASRPAPRPATGPPGGGDHQRPARGERQAQLQHRGVEPDRRELQHPAPRHARRTGPARPPRDSAARRASTPTPFGRPGRPRRVDHVRQPPRRARTRRHRRRPPPPPPPSRGSSRSTASSALSPAGQHRLGTSTIPPAVSASMNASRSGG